MENSILDAFDFYARVAAVKYQLEHGESPVNRKKLKRFVAKELAYAHATLVGPNVPLDFDTIYILERFYEVLQSDDAMLDAWTAESMIEEAQALGYDVSYSPAGYKQLYEWSMGGVIVIHCADQSDASISTSYHQLLPRHTQPDHEEPRRWLYLDRHGEDRGWLDNEGTMPLRNALVEARKRDRSAFPRA